MINIKDLRPGDIVVQRRIIEEDESKEVLTPLISRETCIETGRYIILDRTISRPQNEYSLYCQYRTYILKLDDPMIPVMNHNPGDTWFIDNHDISPLCGDVSRYGHEWEVVVKSGLSWEEEEQEER